jgi:dihydroorotase
MMTRLTITRPDDWHLHLRDGEMLKAVLPHSASWAGRAIIMPNLVPPVVTGNDASAYRARIEQALPDGYDFTPLMVLYLTQQSDPADIRAAHEKGVIQAVKLYPAGATTNSASGVKDIDAVMPVLEMMAECGIPLLVHGEVTHDSVDIFDREAVFIERYLKQMVKSFPNLRVILEHITTQQAVDFVIAGNENIAATITPQHLLYNRNHMLVGGIRPHLFCLPVLKRDIHQKALIEAAVSGNKKFFLGTDSAPHTKESKESCCGCAGCFSHPAAVELYAEVFDQADALDKFEAFASINGADFYGLPYNKTKITLNKESWTIPESLPFGDSKIVPLAAGNNIKWKLEN